MPPPGMENSGKLLPGPMGKGMSLSDRLGGWSGSSKGMVYLGGRGNWSGLRQPLIGRGCSMPGTRPGGQEGRGSPPGLLPGWGPMKPMGPPGKKSPGCLGKPGGGP